MRVSRSLYGFVDWNIQDYARKTKQDVEAYTASWIEIKSGNIYPVGKPVEAYTASWIEISMFGVDIDLIKVEAYTASWIEISAGSCKRQESIRRSLYGFVDWNNAVLSMSVDLQSRSLYGFVDWNFKS